MGFDGTELTPALERMLITLQPAGIILFARNITSPQQTFKLLADCQRVIHTPIFTCVDMEGGTVDRLRNAIGPAPAAGKVAQTGDKKLFEKHGRILGEEVRAALGDDLPGQGVGLRLDGMAAIVRKGIGVKNRLLAEIERSAIGPAAVARVRARPGPARKKNRRCHVMRTAAQTLSR